MSKFVRKTLTAAVLMAGTAASSAWAASDDLRISGFGTLGLSKMGGEADDVRYGAYGQHKDDWTWETVSRAAVQFDYQATDKLDLVLQLIANNQQTANSIDGDVEWAFASYKLTGAAKIRGGKLRLPTYMLSETQDVGMTYPWTRPPLLVYTVIPFTSYYGIDALYTLPLGDGDLLIQPYAGKSEKNDVDFFGARGDLDSDDMYGLSLTYQLDDGKLFFGYNAGDGGWDPEGSWDGTDTDPRGEVTTTDNPYEFWDIGVQYRWHDWQLLAEYSLIDSERNTNVEGVETQIPEHDAWYVTVARSFGKWTPHATVMKRSSWNDGGQVFDLTGEHNGYILGLRYELMPNQVALKFDYEYAESRDGWAGGYSGPSVAADPSKDRESDIVTVAVDFMF